MFSLVSDESTQNLGIGVHLKSAYEMATPLLTVRATHDSTTKDFNAVVSPNYQTINECKIGESSPANPNSGRSLSVSLGNYKTLDVVQEALTALEEWYKMLLERYGAEHRFLVERGNRFDFVAKEDARPTRLGDVILEARAMQAFDMVRQEQDMDYATVVSKIMPIFMQSIGLPGYAVSHDLSKEGFGKVSFLLEELANFSFYQPLEEGRPCYMERHTYRGHDSYYLTYGGEVTAWSLKSIVMNWLIGAARERHNYANIDAYFDDIDARIYDVVTKPRQHQIENIIIDPNAKLVTLEQTLLEQLPDNVVAFRPR